MVQRGTTFTLFVILSLVLLFFLWNPHPAFPDISFSFLLYHQKMMTTNNNIWSAILKTTSSSKRIHTKNVLLLGSKITTLATTTYPNTFKHVTYTLFLSFSYLNLYSKRGFRFRKIDTSTLPQTSTKY